MGENEERLQGQADVFKHMFAFVDTMTLKCVVDLGIPDIINSHGGNPMTASQIMDSIITSCGARTPNLDYLSRIMRFLVSKGIFSAQSDTGTGETLYGLTRSSKWLVTKGGYTSENELMTIAPMVSIYNHQWVINPFNHFSDCVKDGGSPFEKANGHSFWDMALKYPEFKLAFDTGMACTATVMQEGEILVDYYKAEGRFEGIKTVVDVGGGTGTLIKEIIKANPHVRGINFDSPEVIAAAPAYLGVEHVGGDMFVHIPQADVVFLKWVMHNWNDENNVKILKNCHKAIPKKTGKVIIADVVMQPGENNDRQAQNFVIDMLMMALTEGGKERNEQVWEQMLKDGGFPRYKIIQLPASFSIIEAYPE